MLHRATCALRYCFASPPFLLYLIVTLLQSTDGLLVVKDEGIGDVSVGGSHVSENAV